MGGNSKSKAATKDLRQRLKKWKQDREEEHTLLSEVLWTELLAV